MLLGDHLKSLGDKHDTATTMSLLTGQRGEPFYLHVIPLDASGRDVAVSVRELGTSMGAFRTRYRLSRREAEVVELVMLGLPESRYRHDARHVADDHQEAPHARLRQGRRRHAHAARLANRLTVHEHSGDPLRPVNIESLALIPPT